MKIVMVIGLPVLLFSGCVSVVKAPPASEPAPLIKLAAKPALPTVRTMAPGSKTAAVCLDRPNLDALMQRLAILERDDDYVRCAAGTDAQSCAAVANFDKAGHAR